MLGWKKSETDEDKEIESATYDFEENRMNNYIDPLSAHDVISRHAVAIMQWPQHLITSCCSSGLTLFQGFTGVE